MKDNNNLVKIYVLVEELPKIILGNKPSIFWYNKPEDYSRNSTAEMMVDMHTITEWCNGYYQSKFLFD